MNYQLVLQWSASSISDYDAMIEVEDVLIEKLSDAHDIDGHDAGSGEVNIFVLTEDPERAFEEVKSILRSRNFWENIRVAYRESSGSEYTILWPVGLSDFNVT